MTTTTPSDGQKSVNDQGASIKENPDKNISQESSRKFMNYEMVSVELSTLKDMVPRLRKEIRTYAVNESQYMRELEKKLPHCRGIGEIRMQMTIDQIDRLREHKISALDELAQLTTKITELEYRKERNSYEAGEVQWNARLTELASQYCSFSSASQSQNLLAGLEFRPHSIASRSYSKYGRMETGGNHGINIGAQRDSITKGALVNMGSYQANGSSPTTDAPVGNNSASNNFMQLMMQSREIAENRLKAERIRQAVPGIGKALLVEKDRIIFGEDELGIHDDRTASTDSNKKADLENLGQDERKSSKKIGKKKIAISVIVPSFAAAIIAFEVQTGLLRKTLDGLLFG